MSSAHKAKILILILLTFTFTVGCKKEKGESPFSETPVAELAEQSPEQTTHESLSPTTDSIINVVLYDDDEPQQTTAPQSAQPRQRSETIYVSTYGANGQVWGHVTMNGSTGRGTIHDADENTLSIKVTRHGKELYATDQNGRQYVFRLDK